MSKQNNRLVPELRFPEFEKEPNWPCVRLNTVAKRSTSKNKGEIITRVLTNSAVDGIVDQRDYFDKDIAVKGNLESYYIVDKGDYVYNPRISSTAPVGPISKNKVGKGVMSPLYTVFRFNRKKNDFFEQFFKSSRWYGYLQTISNSGARHDRISITSSEFMVMPVPNPSELEQQKIADCLASIDELIALQTQKLNALKAHKKGLMQQLFPAEGESVPKLRFPKFEKEPNWSCVRLNTVAKRSISKNKGEIITRVLTNSAVDGIVDQRDYFDKDIAVKGNLESYYIVDKGDYVYNPRISSTAPVGPISKNKVGKGVMSPLYTVFRFNRKKNDFFEQFFKSSRWYGYLQTISNSGARHDRISITSSEFMVMPVPNPSELEQQRIADCLASIDELIALQTQKLNALKTHKKGLMQKLFPVMDDVV